MKRFPRNVLSLSVSDVVGRFLGFLAVAYLARTLGTTGMGLLAVGMAILAYASIFADAGLPILGTRYAAGNTGIPRTLVKKIFSSRILLTVAVLAMGIFILSILVKDSTTRLIATLYLVSLIPSALFLDWLFQGLNRMVTLSVGRIVGMATYLLFVVLFVSEQGNIALVPLGWIGGNAAQALYLWIAYLKIDQKSLEPDPSPQGLVGLVREGIPLAVATLIAQVVVQFPFIYLGFFDSTSNTGLYSVAFRVIVLLLAVDRVFYTIFFPAIRRSFKRGEDHLRQRFERTFRLVTSGTLYLGTLAILAGDYVFPVIFGADFTESSIIFQLLVVYFVLTVINSTLTFTLIAAEKELTYTRSLGAGAIGFFAIMLLPVPLPPTLLAPIALAIFQAISLMIMIRGVQEITPVSTWRALFLPVAATIVLVAILTPWQHNNPILAFVFALVVALPVLTITAGVNRDDLSYLKRRVV
ncbi:MAG: oligosaccharide flippase family protein [Fidelibacterota bacterium]